MGSLDVTALAYNSSNGDLFAGTSSATPGNGGIYWSVNGGSSWIPVNTGFTDLDARSLICSGSVILAGMGTNTHPVPAAVYSSANTGTISWSNSTTGMVSGAEILCFYPMNTTIFAGGPAGNLYFSHNEGATWNSWHTGLPAGYMFSMTAIGSMLFVAENGFGGGFYRRDTSELSNVGIHEFAAVNASVDVYPNVFNTTTTIAYQLKQEAAIELSVKDLAGNTVSILESDYKQEGNYTITWNAEGMSAGIYFLHMRAGDQVTAKKIVITR